MEVLDHPSSTWPTWPHARRYHWCSNCGCWFVLRSHSIRCLVGEENAPFYIRYWNFRLEFPISFFLVVIIRLFSLLTQMPHPILLLVPSIEKWNSIEKFADKKRTNKSEVSDSIYIVSSVSFHDSLKCFSLYVVITGIKVKLGSTYIKVKKNIILHRSFILIDK